MRRLTTLIKKNFKLIIRSKSSALIVILGPLLLIILIGAAFNTASVYGIRVGAYSESYSPLSEAIIHNLNEKKYTTQKTESNLACIEGIKNGIFHVCAIFPKDLKPAQGGDIVFYVDNSKVNLVYLITETISSQIGEKTKQLSAQLTKTVIDTMEEVENEIKDKEQLIEEIKKKNEETAFRLNKIAEDLTEFRLDYDINDFPLVSLKANINNTEGAAALEVLRRKIEDIIKELSVASSIRKKSVETLSKLGIEEEASRVSITKVQYTFNTIKDEIKSVKETGVGKIVSPIKADIKPITAEKTHLNFIFPTLLVMVIMFVSILMASTLEIREKTSKVYFKNFITPTSDTSFILGNYITNMMVVSIQTTILLIASYFLFKESITPTLFLGIPALFLIISIFVFIGIILGNIFKSEETNTIASISLGFIFLFFSSAILPIETLPTLIKNIAQYNPFFIAERLLNKIILFHAKFGALWKQFTILSSYLVGVVVITFVTKKATKGKR